MLARRVGSAASVAALLALVGIGLVGCTAPELMPIPSASRTPSAAAGPAATAKPGLTIQPGGSATANKPYFDLVNDAFYAANGRSDGKSIIDNLVTAGFRKQDMELTPDNTAIGLQVDSIVFSIRLKGECLVGQFGATGYAATVGPLLGSGGCLIGATRPIDW